MTDVCIVYCKHVQCLIMCSTFSGNAGDDFLALGIKSGRVVHRFNLGSGVATIVSDRLNHHISVHSVTLGRSKRTGWLKVNSLCL